MPSPQQRVAAALVVFGQPQACLAGLLRDRHPADAVAFTIIKPDLTSRDLTFGELRDLSARLATGLAELGVGRGDQVATLMGKSAELAIPALAIWRLGAVQVPLFTAFAPSAVAARIPGNGTTVVITEPAQRAKLEPAADIPADPDRHIVTTGQPAGTDVAFDDLLGAAPQQAPVAVGGTGL
ncbi:AMP-binding protein [Candidatus Protofrankia californiensis]|uniref:AMP-binding protein n=1 Tax=Candidatus Protofrankia californiensis TaxID=1839754 RepID=UPI0019D0EE71|nr:AMP-binding protein [Candidatus Protofrankia californiensis]